MNKRKKKFKDENYEIKKNLVVEECWKMCAIKKARISIPTHMQRKMQKGVPIWNPK
jgi:hypothetical protein